MKTSNVPFVAHPNGSLPADYHERHERSQSQYRWVILALLWLLYSAFGLISRSIFPLVTPILKDLNISYTQMGLILGSWQLTYIFVAIVAGSIIDKWGGRRSISAGVLLIGLSAALRYFSNGFATMVMAVSLFGAGGPMISIGGPKTISEWFIGRSRGTAVGIYMTGPWMGGLLALSLTNSLVMPLTGNSWRLTFVCYGLYAFAAVLLWWFLTQDTGLPRAKESAGLGEVFLRLIRMRNIQILLVMALFSFAVAHGFTGWLPKILENTGLSASRAGFAASIPIAAGIPAVLIIPRLVLPRLRGRFIAVLSLSTIINLMIVVNASGALLIVGLISLGFCSSSLFPLMILMLMDSPEIETRYMGTAGGMFFCVAEIGGFAGPSLMGVLVDVTGTFLIGTIFLSSLCLAIFTMTLFLKPHHMTKQSP
jgi:cyanate permease